MAGFGRQLVSTRSQTDPACREPDSWQSQCSRRLVRAGASYRVGAGPGSCDNLSIFRGSCLRWIGWIGGALLGHYGPSPDSQLFGRSDRWMACCHGPDPQFDDDSFSRAGFGNRPVMELEQSDLLMRVQSDPRWTNILSIHRRTPVSIPSLSAGVRQRLKPCTRMLRTREEHIGDLRAADPTVASSVSEPRRGPWVTADWPCCSLSGIGCMRREVHA